MKDGLTQLDKENLDQLKGPDLQYFNPVGHVLVSYPMAVGPILTILFFILFIIIAIYGIQKKKIVFRSTVIGFVKIVLFTVLYAAGTLLITLAVYSWKSFYMVYFSLPYVIGFYLLSLSVFGFFFKNEGISGFSGIGFFWAIMSIVFLFILPGGHFLFIWPFAGFIVIFGLTILAGERYPRLTAVISALITGMVLMLWCGILLSFYETLTGIFTFVYMLIAIPLYGFLVPLNDYLPVKKGKFIIIGSTISILLIVSSVLVFQFSDKNPEFTSLSYALDLDQNRAFWLSANPKPDRWNKSVFKMSNEMRNIREFIPGEQRKYLSCPAGLMNSTVFQADLIEKKGYLYQIQLKYKDNYDYLVVSSESGNFSKAFLDDQPIRLAGTNFTVRIQGKPDRDPVLKIYSEKPFNLNCIGHQYKLPEILLPEPMPKDMMVLCNTPDFNLRLLKSGETMVKKSFWFK